jgi:Rps23 Pro-64 3,4-dihydroxylase Tpa1-like proline 4-hydroxylase
MPSREAARGLMPPFRIYRDFLAPDEHGRLIAWALAHEACFAPSKVVGDVYNPERRCSVSLQESAGKTWRQELRRRINALVPTFFADLGVPPCDVSMKEFEMVAYRDGAYFKPHIDTMSGAFRPEGGDRILSGVYYFHREPKLFSGGALRLYAFGAGGKGAFVDVPPEQNMLVLFPSWAEHEVGAVSCPTGEFADSRFAVNCWLYRKRAPVS